MEIKILEDRPNPLLKRHEYLFEVAHATEATPNRDSVRTELSKLVKAPKDRVIIERMAARYGTATTRGDALVYETSDAAKSITRDHILIRNGLKEKTVKGASPPAEAPAAEAPKPTTPADTPKAETQKLDAPKEEAPKSEHKGVPKPEHKPDHKSEHRPDHKAEHKPEPKPEHKPEQTPEHAGEPKAEPHKGDHKPKAHKAEKDAEPAKTE